MISKVRGTATGTEYWDDVAKQTLFIRKGDKLDTSGSGKQSDLSKMKLAELAAYAKANGIDIPKGATKRQDIIDFLKANG